MIRKIENKTFSQIFSLTALSGLIVLGACSGAGVKKDYGVTWNEATVSEKGLNDVGCRFVEKVAADGTKSEELVCDNPTPEQAQNREAAMNAYVASSKIALATAKLNPKTMVKLTLRNMKVQNHLIMMDAARAAIPAANAQRNIDRNVEQLKVLTEKTLMGTYKALLSAEKFGCSFDAKNEFVCTKSLADIKASIHYASFKGYLSSLSSSQGKVLALDTKLTKDERSALETQKASVDAFIEDLNCQDCAQ